MEIVILSILLIYSITILFLLKGIYTITPFQKNKVEISKPTETETKFSVLIPFRNEAHNLPHLLNSLAKQTYSKSKYTVYFINDDSEDNSVALIQDFINQNSDLQFFILNRIQSSNSPKKDALNTAIQHVNTEWIITTDADCSPRPNWLKTYHEAILQHHPKMIVGTVMYAKEKSLLSTFQYYDLLSLQGATMGGFGLGKGFMCNGANFCYTKQLFITLKGFEGNDTIASGDDVFLLQKAMLREPKSVYYLINPEHTVHTNSATNWHDLFNQRVRWAAKTTRYTNAIAKLTALIVFVGNTTFVLVVSIGLNTLLLRTIFLYVTVKIIVDSFFIKLSGNKLKVNTNYFELILNGFIYPFFSTAVALIALTGNYNWKERTFRK